ncbi:hypothetical protein HAX54_002342 [Datura stramonium]|uniref:Uncharacterized protein n=1 Tax=Datura stramonium TaxID=4076 RepID=A0ABS8T4H5_DATST|nr:hypothetical protein [Datura stramonium]
MDRFLRICLKPLQFVSGVISSVVGGFRRRKEEGGRGSARMWYMGSVVRGREERSYDKGEENKRRAWRWVRCLVSPVAVAACGRWRRRSLALMAVFRVWSGGIVLKKIMAESNGGINGKEEE